MDLNSILGQIGKDRGIDLTVLVEAIESAMLSAAKKHFGHELNLEAKFNPDSGEVEVVQFRTVVDKVEDAENQMTLDDARKQFDPDAMVGDEIGQRLKTAELGRIAAQAAKQVIIQKVRDAERGVIFEEYKDCKGDLVNGIVQRYDKGNLIINLGRTEAMMPKREQIMKEKYRQGDRVRAMILDVDRSARGPQIILTRSHPDFLKKLFTLEVPEISDGSIELKAVAREPGERAKIAVHSTDSSIDPVGACVGIKGTRVQAVVQELRGERVDIVTWTSDEPSFVARALSPAEVARVVVDEDNHSMEVIVADDQLSLAIGRRGTNVKLASKLSGWRIDVRSLSVAEEESKRAREALQTIPGIEFTHAEMLFQAGYRRIKEIVDATLEDLEEDTGLSLEVCTQIQQSAAQFLEAHPEFAGDDDDSGTISDLGRLSMDRGIKDKLISEGYKTIQNLVETDLDSLVGAGGLEESEVEQIRESLDAFLKATQKSPSAQFRK